MALRFPKPSKPTPTKGRVLAVCGASGVGTSTLIDLLHKASRQTVAVCTVTTDTATEEIDDFISDARAVGTTDVVVLDGCPRTARDVQYLYDASWVYPGEGAVVYVRRGLHLDEAERDRLTALEAKIQELDVPYFTIHNEQGEHGLNAAVMRLAKIGGITR